MFCIISFFCAFAPIFHFKLCSNYLVGAQKYFCPRAQGTLATPLVIAVEDLIFSGMQDFNFAQI